MIGFVLTGAFLFIAFVSLFICPHADAWIVLALFGIAALWYMGYQLCKIHMILNDEKSEVE